MADFPEFVVRDRGASPEFLEFVKDAIHRVQFDSRTMFTKNERQILRAIKTRGSKHVFNQLDTQSQDQGVDDAVMIASYTHFLGNILMRVMDSEELDKFIPFSDFQVLPTGNKLQVITRSMLTAKGKGGTIYYSKQKPKIEVEERMRIVGFTRHAARERCHRIEPEWKDYLGMGDVFGHLHDCLYYEKAALADGSLAFTFYDVCKEGFWKMGFVEAILGESRNPDSEYYVRVGYCPAVVDGDFLVGKTFLPPGFRNTPEHRLILDADCSKEERKKMLLQADNQAIEKLRESNDFSLVKWFHENGIRQIFCPDRPLHGSPFE